MFLRADFMECCMNINPESISSFNKLMYVICVVAAVVVYLDVTVWRP